MKSTNYGLSRSGMDAVGQHINMILVQAGLPTPANGAGVSTLVAL
jgi:hypothetical protein